MYKQYIVTLVFSITCCSFLLQAHSQSVFIPRSLTTNMVLELGLTNYQIYHRMLDYDEDFYVGFYITPFYTETNNACSLARLLLPTDCNAFSVAEDGGGAIGSQWLSIPLELGDPFYSRLLFAPKRKALGAYVYLYLNFDEIIKGTWCSVSSALMHAEHNMHLSEHDLSSTHNQGALEAFQNPLWDVGIVSATNLEQSGSDDVQVKCGKNWLWDDENHGGIYAVTTIPTGEEGNERFLFSPIVGSRHASLGVGATFDVGRWIADEQFLNLMIDGSYRYFFSASEKRSFDLSKNGNWSRYMQLVTFEHPTEPFPAINVLTRDVTVRPNSRLQLWSAVHYEYYNWNVELGYNYWWRHHETIGDLKFEESVGIWDSAASPKETAISSSNALISNGVKGLRKAPSDVSFAYLQAADLNLSSAEHPSASTHTVYAAFSYDGEMDENPCTIGCGGSYEFAYDTAAFNQWSAWFKLGFGF